jgi:hypothetical protein
MLGHLPFREIGAAFRRPFRNPGRCRLIQVLLIWLAIHAVFFTWWKPGHTRFWLLALPGWTLLLQLGIAARWRRGLAKPTVGQRGQLRWPRAAIASFAFAAAVAVIVWSGSFRRETDPACNRFLPLAQSLADHTAENGTVIISGIGPYTALKAYVPYFSRRNMLILDWQFADKSVPPARALDILRAKIDRLKAGGPVYLLSEVLDPELDGHFERTHGVSGGARRKFFAGFKPRPAVTVGPGMLLFAL